MGLGNGAVVTPNQALTLVDVDPLGRSPQAGAADGTACEASDEPDGGRRVLSFG